LEGWAFDAHYTHGYVHTEAEGRNEIFQQHLYAALDAVRDPATGNIVCRTTLTHPGLHPGCVPYNPFVEGANSAAVRDYLLGTTRYDVYNKTDNLAFNITGEPFSTWAG